MTRDERDQLVCQRAITLCDTDGKDPYAEAYGGIVQRWAGRTMANWQCYIWSAVISMGDAAIDEDDV